MNKRTAEDDSVCSFYLERKKRPCRMKKVEGKAYCPHHSHLGSEIDEKKGPRIPCPYDSSHFCYQSKLQKHLKICNAREKEKPNGNILPFVHFGDLHNLAKLVYDVDNQVVPKQSTVYYAFNWKYEYFVENVNAGEVKDSDEIKVNLNDVSDDEVLAIVKKIKLLYDESNISISSVRTLHPLLESEMKKIDDGFNNFKHTKQQATLLSLLERERFLSDGCCFVEFGAGKGELMYWIVQCVPEKDKCAFVLIDRSAQRHKKDNKYKGSDITIERIRIDIQHLHLGKIASIKPSLNKVVGVSKHLCGSATDLALRCLTNTLKIKEGEVEIHHKALGFVMALCCHHRCTWSSYIGKDFMMKKNISERDFKLMCCVASWATCGLRKTVSKNVEENCIEDTVQNEMLHSNVCAPEGEALLNRYLKLNLKHEEREEIGMQCKRLIDMGRMDYLQKHGYQVELVSYIDKSISLENVALIGFYKGS